MSGEKPTYEELVEMVIDLVNQTAVSEVRDEKRVFRHSGHSTYEQTFDILEGLGKLEYVDKKKRLWAWLKW